MIEARYIHKQFGEVEVLKGIDLLIPRASVTSIVGASGAGKTTLLQILGTLDVADQGELKYDDQIVSQLSPKQLAAFRNKHIGFIFQFHQLLPEFTALENVCLPGMIGNRPVDQLQTRAKELLDYLGLSHRLTHKPAALSGGEQQRVAVARSLINNPDVVFADEPSGNLDSANAEELHTLFFKLREEFKQTFVIVTHNNALADMADTKLVMKDGQIVNPL